MKICKHKRCGMTMIEVMVALTITTVMVTAMVGMFVATAGRAEVEMSQGSTDTDASLALQQMVSDIREAESVTIQVPGPASGTQLLVVHPVRVTQTQGGYYDRSRPDTTEPVYYYLSDATGAMGKAGAACTILWRQETKNGVTTARIIRRNVAPGGLLFETDVPKSVQITIRAQMAVSRYARKKGRDATPVYTELTDKVVYLRNYQ